MPAPLGKPQFKHAAAVATLATAAVLCCCGPFTPADGDSAASASANADLRVAAPGGFDLTAAERVIGSAGGGPITRTEIIDRAQSWVTERVPYGGRVWTDRNGSYRPDCSGYASMAWDLVRSYTTHTIADASFATRVTRAALQPGDLVDDPAEHVLIFAGWIDRSTRTFRYYAQSHPGARAGMYAGSFARSSLAGWPTGDYVFLRYNRVAAAVAAPAAVRNAAPAAAPAVATPIDAAPTVATTETPAAPVAPVNFPF